MLSVDNERHLLDWADRFSGWCHPSFEIEAPWTIFFEPDINEHTALAALLTKKQARHLSHLPLALREEVNDNE